MIETLKPISEAKHSDDFYALIENIVASHGSGSPQSAKELIAEHDVKNARAREEAREKMDSGRQVRVA